MIEAIRGKGVNRAKVTCDSCGQEETVPCGYIRTNPHNSEPDKGQVIKKLTASGWAEVKGVLRCKTCEAKRKVDNQEAQVVVKEAKAEVPRAPTTKQKREIIGMLEIVYDDDRKRFNDGESDKSVADAIGGGVLWGWVAQVREELFGPDSRSQEIEEIRKEAARLADALATAKSESGKMIAGVEAKLDALHAKLEKAIA